MSYFTNSEIFQNYPNFFDNPDIEDYYGTDSPFLLDPSARDKKLAERQIRFIVERLALQGNERILDMGCGHGRLALPLARRGYPVTGVDLSEYLLDTARESAAKEESLQIGFEFCGLLAMPYWEEFDAALSVWNSFGYHEDLEGWMQVVTNAYQALAPGGRFFLDVPNRLWEFNYMLFHEEFDSRGTKIIVDRMGDTAQRRINEKVTVIRDDDTRQFGMSYLVFAPDEVQEVVREVGFEILDAAGDWDGSELNEDSPRILITAQKTHSLSEA